MNTAKADALTAREHLAACGWIAPRNESFRHLPPPPAGVWLGECRKSPDSCDASPLSGTGWTLYPVGDTLQCSVAARWLDASDPQQRAELFSGLAQPGDSDASPSPGRTAPCAARVCACVGASPSEDPGKTVWLHLRHQSRSTVEAPMLVMEVPDGVRCVLIESHDRDPAQCQHSLTQNLHVHLHLGQGALLQHLRIATPGPGDQVAHMVHVRLGQDAQYAQALVAAGSQYHLQRTMLDLQAPHARARTGAVLLAHAAALEQQVQTIHQAAHTESTVEALALASGPAHVVANAHTRINPGADEACVRQRLHGVPLAGEPRLVLRPHLEILHDKVQAAHGATWGALPQEALFYACQRGLDEPSARALILEGMATALLERCFDDPDTLATLSADGLLARTIAQQLRHTMVDMQAAGTQARATDSLPPGLRDLFPVLQQRIHGAALAYLDNAATTQMPLPVLSAMRQFEETQRANIHRGVHTLSQRATDAFEQARSDLKRFIGASDAHELVFTSGTTESLNLVAHGLGTAGAGPAWLRPGDEIIVSGLEHHANLVPWQQLARRSGATLRILRPDAQGRLHTDDLARLLTPRTRVFAITACANATGERPPYEDLLALAAQAGALTVLDAAQAVAHAAPRLSQLDCDFMAFSGHKMYGPMGIGALVGRRSALERLTPLRLGGDMVEWVTYEDAGFAGLPARLEGGTPHVAGAVGMAAAAAFIDDTGRDVIDAHVHALRAHAVAGLAAMDGITVLAPHATRSALVSFVARNVHPHDIGTLLDGQGIAVRTGHHCAQPLLDHLGVGPTTRASFAVYNTHEEVERLLAGVARALEMLK